MKAGSKAALDAALDRWESVTTDYPGDLATLAKQFTVVVDTLDENSALARALTDPARSGDDKAALVQSVFGGNVDGVVLDLLAGMVRDRWSADADLATAVENIAVDTILAHADRQGTLDRLSTELFDVAIILERNRDLRMALGEREADPERRVALMDRVFGSQVLPETLAMLHRMVESDRHPSVMLAIKEVAEFASARRGRLTAIVTAAIPLTEAQVARLQRVLTAQYGKPVRVNVAVEPSVVGGVRIAIDDDLMDATIATRIEKIRRQFAE